jgi:hypothetical protein
MQRRTLFRVGVCVFIALLAMAANDAKAQSFCDAECGWTVSCDRPCVHPDTYQTVTCGQGWPCEDNTCWWYETSRQQIGANQGGAPPVFCNYYVTFLIHESATCGGQRTRCDHWQDGFGVGMDCCSAWGCWGANSC